MSSRSSAKIGASDYTVRYSGEDEGQMSPFRVACWGRVLYDEPGLLERIHERFTPEVYEHILANVMIPSARKRYPEGTLFFQQDNHPIHTANRIQRWFTRRRDVDPVDWSPDSPDMNPIKNLWAAVKRILRSNWAEQPPVRTPEELWDRVLDAWEEMAKNLDLFHNLVDSMPSRMRAVFDAGVPSYPMDHDVRSKLQSLESVTLDRSLLITVAAGDRNPRGHTALKCVHLSLVQTVQVSVMDSKVAALMAALRGHLLAPVLPTAMVVVHTDLALFTVQIGKSFAVSSVANTHGQKETKPPVRAASRRRLNRRVQTGSSSVAPQTRSFRFAHGSRLGLMTNHREAASRGKWGPICSEAKMASQTRVAAAAAAFLRIHHSIRKRKRDVSGRRRTMARNTLTMADRIKIITLMEQNMRQVDVANILHVNQTSATTLRHDLREATGVVVSSQTVRNRPHDIGLYVRRPLKTPALRPHHRGARA
ncbi:hypothetical protein ANN_19328 [Periplaneta americana]|uniref:Tc1-like transposase DDE domain-containing protein n=1 Tax=Periplaneta americana TaxID=6978 RepID=A0ABQ8S9K3_PERAM|nr:hypothetical protein ANN_19328 [Periplaneta americana]